MKKIILFIICIGFNISIYAQSDSLISGVEIPYYELDSQLIKIFDTLSLSMKEWRLPYEDSIHYLNSYVIKKLDYLYIYVFPEINSIKIMENDPHVFGCSKINNVFITFMGNSDVVSDFKALNKETDSTLLTYFEPNDPNPLLEWFTYCGECNYVWQLNLKQKAIVIHTEICIYYERDESR